MEALEPAGDLLAKGFLPDRIGRVDGGDDAVDLLGLVGGVVALVGAGTLTGRLRLITHHGQLGADLDGLVLVDLDLEQGAGDGGGDLGVDLVGGHFEQGLVDRIMNVGSIKILSNVRRAIQEKGKLLLVDFTGDAGPGDGGDVLHQAVAPCSVIRIIERAAHQPGRKHLDVESGTPGQHAEALAEHLARSDVHVWTARVGRRVAGFFELVEDADGGVEIAYFGLLPAFIGQGLGGALLARAVEEAWRLGSRRVWLHTCSLDAPQALPNYIARGFRVERTEEYDARVRRTAVGGQG